jgi:hypothetical protein
MGYTCEHCGGTFVSPRPEDEALEELRSVFGQSKMEDCVIVCDTCYNKIMAAMNS